MSDQDSDPRLVNAETNLMMKVNVSSGQLSDRLMLETQNADVAPDEVVELLLVKKLHPRIFKKKKNKKSISK